MTYKVTFTTNNTYTVKQKNPSKIKASTSYTMAQKLADLEDVNLNNSQDKYLLSYDSVTQKWKSVNPDDVLSAAVNEPESPGLPADFVNQLDIDLDNKIDLDAGGF